MIRPKRNFLDQNGRHWTLALLFESIVLSAVRLLQPRCEPCPVGVDCPPCISTGQIAWAIAGLAVGVVFMVWQVRLFLRKGK